MIGLKVNGIFLELDQENTAEIERESPFFSIESINAEYTTPISIKYTEDNCNALGMRFQFTTERQKVKIEAEAYDGKSFKGKCLLVVEAGQIQYKTPEASTLTGYVLFGISQFFQSIKDKKIKDLELGGARPWTFTTFNPEDGSAGYWQHFHETWLDDRFPYVFQPVRNETFLGEGGPIDWMNKLGPTLQLLDDPENVLVPMPRLKYILQCIFTEHGYTIDFSGLNDNQWEKIILINARPLQWTTVEPRDGVIAKGPAHQIVINLQNHVDQSKTIADLIINLFKRYGWTPILDGKRCTYIALKEFPSYPPEDWTSIASPLAETSFNTENKSYLFKTTFAENDTFPSPPDFSQKRIGKPVPIRALLPVASYRDDNILRFCYFENQWYTPIVNEATNIYEWQVWGDNIYDYEKPNSIDTIETEIAPVPSYRTEIRPGFFGYFPMVKIEKNKDPGFRTTFFHYRFRERTADDYLGTYMYPYAAPTPDWLSGNGEPLTGWADVYKLTTYEGTVFARDFGLISYWWKNFLQFLQVGEQMQFKIQLSLVDLAKINWRSAKLIGNIPFILQSLIEEWPYTGQIIATLKRIAKTPPEIEVIEDSHQTDYYVKLTEVNRKLIDNRPFLTNYLYKCDYMINIYADAMQTTPVQLANPIYVLIKKIWQNNESGTPSYEQSDYYQVKADGEILIKGVTREVHLTADRTDILAGETTYELDPVGANGYIIV